MDNLYVALTTNDLRLIRLALRQMVQKRIAQHETAKTTNTMTSIDFDRVVEAVLIYDKMLGI